MDFGFKKGSIPYGPMNYVSPIQLNFETLTDKLIQEEEKVIMRGIINAGVEVDKDELIKALKYDRDQYTKGYKDGFDMGYKAGVDHCTARLKELMEEYA